MIIFTLFLTCLFPKAGFAAANLNASGQTNTANITLENAIQNVKQFFPVPNNLNNFSSSFDNSNNRQVWRLQWDSQNNETGSMSAEVDAATGEVWSMHFWKQNDASFSKTPTLSVLEARQKGQALLNNLLPNKIADLRFQETPGIVPLGEYNSPQYTMDWQRFYKNIKVAGDTASMTVDMQTGEITDYNLLWADQKLPEPVGLVSSEKASSLFISQEMLKLQYKLNRSMPKTMNTAASTPQLVYIINHPSNGLIDAFTGQPLINQAYGLNYEKARDGIAGPGSNSPISAPVPLALTPEEQKEIEKSAQYLSQEQAINIVKKVIRIPETMILHTASIEKNWADPEQRCWNLGWQTEGAEGKDAAQDYIWVQIDAINGELLSFNQTVPANDNPKTMIKEDGQTIAENFIKSILPQLWPQIKLSSTSPEINPLDKKQRNWSFYYDRLVNGIPCPDNGISINVDASLNQVSSFSSNWYRHDFPAAGNVMNKDQANQKFFNTAPLTLYYYRTNDWKGEDAGIKLVYIPDMKNGFYMLDAVSGASLDMSGQALSNNPQAYSFNDIKGHFGENEISMLGQAGIFGEYGSSFHPDENVKLVSMLRAMLIAKDGIYSIQGVSDDEIMQRCRRRGWIGENTAAQDNVSREILAQLMIRFLDIDYLSQVQGIYRVPYQDSSGMSPATQAYASLCWGLSIIRADGINFNAKHNCSRAEAAIALVKTLSVKTKP